MTWSRYFELQAAAPPTASAVADVLRLEGRNVSAAVGDETFAIEVNTRCPQLNGLGATDPCSERHPEDIAC